MKKFIVLLMCILAAGCSKENGPTREKLIEENEWLHAQINERLDSMYQDLGRCDALAKCLGYASGKVLYKRSSDLGGGIIYFNDSHMYACSMGEKNNVEISNIKPMLEGCQNRKCGTSCPEKK